MNQTISFNIILFSVFLFGFSLCGPKTEKSMTYKGSSGLSQLYPEQPWRYSPEFAFDGKKNTSFCVDLQQSYPGFTLYLENHTEFSAIQVINGFAKSAIDASQNSQIKKLKITTFSVSMGDNKTKINAEDSVILTLKPVSFRSDKVVEEAVDLGKRLKGNWIRLEFLDSHKGTKHKDICLSEFKFGAMEGSKFTKYPIVNEEKINAVIQSYEEAYKHYRAFKKLISANEAGSINFYDQNTVLPVFFKADQTFSFSEMFGGDTEAGGNTFDPGKQGSFTILASSATGIEINLSYFNAEGLEKNDTWIFKRVVPGDEDFEYFKTKLGTQFSEVYNPKIKYLLFFKDVNKDRLFYNYEIPYN